MMSISRIVSSFAMLPVILLMSAEKRYKPSREVKGHATHENFEKLDGNFLHSDSIYSLIQIFLQQRLNKPKICMI